VWAVDIGDILKAAKTAKADGEPRKFVLAAELDDSTKNLLDAIRDKARKEGKILSNSALMTAAIGEFYRAYVQSE
jgi:hypothetical protein